MAKIKNRHIYSKDQEYLKNLQIEYKEYGDWDTRLENGCLTIFALKRKKPKKATHNKRR